MSGHPEGFGQKAERTKCPNLAPATQQELAQLLAGLVPCIPNPAMLRNSTVGFWTWGWVGFLLIAMV